MFRAGFAPRDYRSRPAGAARATLPLAPRLRVGLYGGSFNPVHEGHAHVAQTARRRLGLDRVIWLVAPVNPLKAGQAIPAISERLAEVASMAGAPGTIVSDLEARIAARYTIDTVRWLRRRFPGVDFVWLMGADSLADFHRWRGWASLAREIPIAVVSRPGTAIRSRFSPLARRFAASRLPERAALTLAGHTPPAWIYLTAPYRHVSSTALRGAAAGDSRLTGGAVRAMGAVKPIPAGASADL